MDTDDFTFTLDSADADTGDRERLLRRSLQLDAAASGGLGVLLAAGGAVLDGPLGIPAAVLVPVGGFLVLYGGALWLLGRQPRLSRPAVKVVVAGNLVWVAASVVAAVAGWWSPTTLGTVLVVAQAAAVVLFAELQLTGLRRARPPAAQGLFPEPSGSPSASSGGRDKGARDAVVGRAPGADEQ